MWILIMEQLVLYYTPLVAIVHNILSVIKAIAPKIEVKELPSISTISIRKGCTIIIMDTVCHTLAAYKTSKS
jgi:hypothetical protein